jgi:hypothetical protein
MICALSIVLSLLLTLRRPAPAEARPGAAIVAEMLERRQWARDQLAELRTQHHVLPEPCRQWQREADARDEAEFSSHHRMVRATHEAQRDAAIMRQYLALFAALAQPKGTRPADGRQWWSVRRVPGATLTGLEDRPVDEVPTSIVERILVGLRGQPMGQMAPDLVGAV